MLIFIFREEIYPPMLKKFLSLLFLAAICSSNLFAQDHPSEKIPEGRKVPIVTYTPHYFYGQVVDAFKNPEQDCYIFTKDTLYAYRSPNYIPNSNQYRPRIWSNYSWTSIEKKGSFYSKEMLYFREIIQKNDSCFFLKIAPHIFQKHKLLGILKNGTMRFVSSEGDEFASLGEIFEDQSAIMEYFVRDYLDAFKIALYNDNYGNCIYYIHSDEEAAQALKKNYYYQYYQHQQDTLANIQGFVDYIKAASPLCEGQEAILKARILKHLRNNTPLEEYNSYNGSLDYYLNGELKLIVMGQQVDSLLNGIISQPQYKRLKIALHFQREQILSALSYLFSKYPEIAPNYSEIVDFEDPIRKDYERAFEYLASKGVL